MPGGAYYVSSHSDFDSQTLLAVLLEHLPVGVSWVDRGLNTVLVNRAFVELLELPASMFEDRARLPTLEELYRFNARRGEYGPGDPDELTAQRMALARQGRAHRLTRVRPNGRALQVVGVSLPDGGFVSIYSDISEQQQAQEALRQQALYLRSVLDHLPQGISVFDQELRLKCWNGHLLEVLELPEGAVYQDVPFEDLILYPARRGEYGPGDPHELVAQRRQRALQFQAHRFERTRPNGRTHLVEGRPMVSQDAVVGFVTSYTDVTKEKAVEQQLRHQSEVFQTLVDNIPGGVTLFGPDLRLLASNQEFARLLDFPAHLFDEAPTFERFIRFNAERGEYGRCDAEAKVQEIVALARRNEAHQFVRTRPNGVILEVRGLPLATGGFVTIYTDITEKHHAAQAIERLAHRDVLTGLSNRYTLEARLDQLVVDARRHQRAFAVMFLDMDNFKGINDTLGHAVGDEFLCTVAQRLLECVRENDIVARLGGDEFVVVLAELGAVADASAVATKIAQAVAQPLELAGQVLRSSASIGICCFPQDGDNRGALMQSADIAMYHAKKAGKGQFHYFDAAMMNQASVRVQAERDLRVAVEQGQFELHYQPLLNPDGFTARGVEALMRWRKPDGTMVSPLEFIPLAEELGLIVPMGDWALREACRVLAAWQEAGLEGLSMAVNLSAVQLGDAGLPERIAQALQQSGLKGRFLTLEVTESVAMQDPQTSVQRLEQIRALGVQLAMDDFGTGYSSLAYLKRLPLNYLKLDKAFVMDLETDSNDAAICTATIGLAHNLGLTVVAEGVETTGQRDFLVALGCDALQGYLFSKPLPEAQALAWLQAHRVRFELPFDSGT